MQSAGMRKVPNQASWSSVDGVDGEDDDNDDDMVLETANRDDQKGRSSSVYLVVVNAKDPLVVRNRSIPTTAPKVVVVTIGGMVARLVVAVGRDGRRQCAPTMVVPLETVRNGSGSADVSVGLGWRVWDRPTVPPHPTPPRTTTRSYAACGKRAGWWSLALVQ